MTSPRPLITLRLRSWLLLSHFVVLCLPLAVLWGTGAASRDLERQTRRTLLQQARLLTVHIESELVHARAADPNAALQAVTPRITEALAEIRATDAGVRILDPTGRVVASTGPGLGADLGGREEVQEALAGRIGSATRSSPPPLDSLPPGHRQNRVYLAAPIENQGRTVGVVLVSRVPRELLQVARNIATRLTGGVALAVVLTVLVGLIGGRMLTLSLTRLVRAARALADGSTDAPELRMARSSPVEEVRVLAAAFDDTADRLQARLNYIAEFASNVSHEFKTPLATLRGTVELLSDDDDMPPAQRAHFLSNALEELDRLERLVTGLLALARAEEGGRREEIDLVLLCRDVAERQERVRVQGQGSVRASGDPIQLAAAIDNLVVNAIQHGEAERIDLRAWAEGEQVGIEVRDDGRGISAANLHRVFDRFFTTDRARGGTGLGLAIVRAVSRAHGGDVQVHSQPGDTVFSIRLPRSGAPIRPSRDRLEA